MNKISVLTIGNFDGIHLGHRKLLSRVVQIAHQEKLQSVVLSYTDHPAFTLKAHAAPQMLYPATQKKQELLALGIDKVELLSFTKELATTTALNFLREYILPVWQPRVIVMGYDSHFGHRRLGNYQFLLHHAIEYGYRVEYIEPLQYNSVPISSSLIREQLAGGQLSLANQLLSKPYRMAGVIGHGTSRGHSFGFPTANLILSCPHQLIPKSGIYLSRVFLEGESYFGLTNIGISPTVKHTNIVEIETHILDFDREIYGNSLELELLQYLREEMMFKNVDCLIAAMHKDLALARQLISGMQK